MWALIWIIITLILVISTFLVINEGDNQASDMLDKNSDMIVLSNHHYNLTKKQLVELMKKYQYCSKDTTKSDIKFIKDGGLINLKCNWWFSKKFVDFLNENNYYNKYRFNSNHYIFVYKDTEWTKDIKHIKDTDNYKNITIGF